ncbi:MAG TPA: 2-hydroxymuconate tautomerase [Thermopetrobacter sp.]|nr:2-hydroxymuconate tautomerase [Thermopetrobacter sp.]
MPIVHITLLEGRDDEKKAALIREVTDAVHRAIGAPAESVRVVLHEVKKTEFGIGGKSAAELGR